MCGVTGFLDTRASTPADQLAALASAMADALVHRGPDDAGTWVDPAAGIALGHRRLSILDLSPLGHQPMLSADGRWVLGYNGELYNFGDLRTQLEGRGHRFRGHSDTEVLVEAISEWGVDSALSRSTGMFAFAAWDRAEGELTLARDRVGEKPMYYGWQGPVLLFGSELKALTVHPSFAATVDTGALALLLRHNFISSPWCIYEGVRKLEPGTLYRVRAADGRSEVRRYWRAADAAARGTADPLDADDESLVSELDRRLAEAVRSRLHADVGLGAFLSGGIDSSTVVAMMQAHGSRPVRTFTIGFHEAAWDEAGDARAVARSLGTEHTELYVTPDEAMAVIPRLPAIYDEPFADTSEIPMVLVADLARTSVTVALSGDGGDELFGGYNRHMWAPRIWRRLSALPAPARRALGWLASMPSWDTLDGTLRRAEPVLPRTLRARNPGDKAEKAAKLLRVETSTDVYGSVMSYWDNPESVVLGATARPSVLTGPLGDAPSLTLAEEMMLRDQLGYLPDHNLVKVDRATMQTSLEARAPLLDHELVEFAWRVPLSHKLRDGEGKWLLRKVLHRYVPPELVERPKMGFGVPVGAWLRGPLRSWAEDLLDPRRLSDEGYLAVEPVRRAWDEHLAGRHNWQHRLWSVLMFQAWLETVGRPTRH